MMALAHTESRMHDLKISLLNWVGLQGRRENHRLSVRESP